MNFTEFWSKFPAKSKHKGSKANAEKLWNKLNIYERHAVDLSLPVYEEHLGENEWKNPMMAQTYLGPGRHWESFQPATVVKGQIVKIDERREETRERNRRNQDFADEQWADRFEKRHGYRPNTVRS